MRDKTPNNSGQNLAQIGMCLAQGSSGGALSNNWNLLYSCSTISCTKKYSIVSKFTVILLEEHLHIYSNGGHMDYTIRGILDILHVDMYVNNNFMANIPFIKELADSFRVNMDTKEDHTMLAHCSQDKAYIFKKIGTGMY